MITYLCGGINGLSDSDACEWRAVATKALLGSVLDPMARDYRGIEDSNVAAIVEGDLDAIGWSDTLLVNATRPSWGTAMELVYAHQAKKRIIAFVGESRVSPWLRFHATAVVQTLDQAIELANGGA